ncbi:MAG: ParB/RepB/Spo0J family partition protein [Waterburya sp.]
MPKPPKKSLVQMRSPVNVAEELPIDRLLAFDLNPRTWFDPLKLQELADSIIANDLIAPIIVREAANRPEFYEVIIGARRVEAHKIAGKQYIKGEIRVLSDREALILAKEENNNRVDTSPIEDTISTLKLIRIDTQLEQEEIISLLYQMAKGRNVPTDFQTTVEKVFQDLKTITLSTFTKDRLRLLNLPKNIYEAIRQGNIEPTKGVEIAKLKDEVQQQELLETAIAEGLSLASIKLKIAELKGKAVAIDYSQLPAEDLEAQIRTTYGKLSRNKKIWSNPAKRKQIESLLKSLNRLVES